MFSVAVATVLFPSLSRFATRGDLTVSGDTVGPGVRQINFLLIPTRWSRAVLAEPIVRLLYERGAFDARPDAPSSRARSPLLDGFTFNGAMLMLNRGFFSLQSPGSRRSSRSRTSR